MEKHRMLSFSELTRIMIETAASAVLLFCAAKLFGGVAEQSQTQIGNGILLFFGIVFAGGGCIGMMKTYRKYKRYRKEHPHRR